MDPEWRVVKALEDAQGILARHVEPGSRNCEQTINRLLDLLDDEAVAGSGGFKDGKANYGATPRTQEALRDRTGTR